MKKVVYIIAVVLIAAGTLSSCVAKKKYVAATNANKELQGKNAALSSQLNNANKSIDDLQREVNTLSSYYSDASNKLNLSKEQVREQQERLTKLQGLIYAQQKNTEALRKKIAEALVNFNTEDLTVSMKNGKVYVSMQESLLFPSGSAVVNEKGKTALAKLAAVLQQNPEIHVEVEGHTDNKPIKTAKYQDNWALSVGRSTAIARILTEDYGVNAKRVLASGQSEYSPVALNDTEAGRAQNRRTEIILEPDLDELMRLIRDVPTVTTK